MLRLLWVLLAIALVCGAPAAAQEAPPPDVDSAIQQMVKNVQADRLEDDVQTMVDFHTRHTLRVFSQPRPDDLSKDWSARFFGGENDGPSRQLARYVAGMAETYVRNLEPILIYRLDRFGRRGDQMPFVDRGFPAVRVMETQLAAQRICAGRHDGAYARKHCHRQLSLWCGGRRRGGARESCRLPVVPDPVG